MAYYCSAAYSYGLVTGNYAAQHEMDLHPVVSQQRDDSYDQDPHSENYCFLAGVSVRTDHGTKPIETIAVGDMVLARDVNNGEQGFQPVLRTFRNTTERVTSVAVAESDGMGQTIECTPGHVWYVHEKGRLDAADLQKGDRLLTARGDLAEVHSVQTNLREAETFNLEVGGWHTYFVSETPRSEELLVHNDSARRITRETEERIARMRPFSRRFREQRAPIGRAIDIAETRSAQLQSELSDRFKKTTFSAAVAYSPATGTYHTVLSSTNGREFAELVRRRLPGEFVVRGTGHAEVNAVVEAVRLGFEPVAVGAGLITGHCPRCVRLLQPSGVILTSARRRMAYKAVEQRFDVAYNDSRKFRNSFRYPP